MKGYARLMSPHPQSKLNCEKFQDIINSIKFEYQLERDRFMFTKREREGQKVAKQTFLVQ